MLSRRHEKVIRTTGKKNNLFHKQLKTSVSVSTGSQEETLRKRRLCNEVTTQTFVYVLWSVEFSLWFITGFKNNTSNSELYPLADVLNTSVQRPVPFIRSHRVGYGTAVRYETNEDGGDVCDEETLGCHNLPQSRSSEHMALNLPPCKLLTLQ